MSSRREKRAGKPRTTNSYLRDNPEGGVRTLDRILAHYQLEDLKNELVWLDQWRR